MDWTDGALRPNSYFYRLATDKKEEGSAVRSLSENDINNIPVNDDIQGTEQSWLDSQYPVSSKNYQ